MFCPNCGAEVAEGRRFCGKCGAQLRASAISIEATQSVSGSTVEDVESAPAQTTLPSQKGGTSRYSRAIIATIAVVVVIAAAGYWWMHRSHRRHKSDNSGLYHFNINGKYGFMDRSGKVVITPQFDHAGMFSEGLAAVENGTKYGYVNTRGELAITPQFDEAGPFSEGLAYVMIGSKFGYIDKKGKVVITPQFDLAREFHNGRAVVKLCCGRIGHGEDSRTGRIGSDRYAFIDKGGKNIGPPSLLYVHWWINIDSGAAGDATLVRTIDDRLGIMNGSGRISFLRKVSEIHWISDFSDGLAPARSSGNGKWGYLNANGDWAIEPQFEYASGFENGLATVGVAGRQGLIDRKGKFVINPQFYSIFGASEGYAITSTDNGSVQGCQYCGIYGFLNIETNVALDAKIVQHPNPDGSYSSPIAPFSEGLAAVKTEEGWGFMDTTGKMVIAPQFDEVRNFEDGLAFVKVLGKETYITKTGAFVLDPFPGRQQRQ